MFPQQRTGTNYISISMILDENNNEITSKYYFIRKYANIYPSRINRNYEYSISLLTIVYFIKPLLPQLNVHFHFFDSHNNLIALYRNRYHNLYP